MLSLLDLLEGRVALQSSPPPAGYQVPGGTKLAVYLRALGQLLEVRCRVRKGIISATLTAEREMVEGMVQLCRACPQNITTRLLLAGTLAALKDAEILPEFADPVARLQQEHPLPEPAQRITQQILRPLLPPPRRA